MIEKVKSVYGAWLPVRRNMPRTERFGIGTKIDSFFLELFDLLRNAAYANPYDKIPLLEKAITKIDGIRFFLQLSWELSLMHNNHYAVIAKDIEEIGRMVGGWKKGLIAKTSASRAEERRE